MEEVTIENGKILLSHDRQRPLTLSLLVETSCLLITFANSLDPDQDQQKVGSDLYPTV